MKRLAAGSGHHRPASNKMTGVNMNNFKQRIGKTLFTGMLLASVATLAACNTTKEKVDPLAGGGGLAGNWVSGDNVFTANFNAGQFIATTNDTGTVISEGNYVVSSASEVNLNWTGKLTGQPNSAVCQRPDPNLLSCTDAGGKTFTMRKQV